MTSCTCTLAARAMLLGAVTALLRDRRRCRDVVVAPNRFHRWCEVYLPNTLSTRIITFYVFLMRSSYDQHDACRDRPVQRADPRAADLRQAAGRQRRAAQYAGAAGRAALGAGGPGLAAAPLR